MKENVYMSHPMEIMHGNHCIILDWKGQIVVRAKKVLSSRLLRVSLADRGRWLNIIVFEL